MSETASTPLPDPSKQPRRRFVSFLLGLLKVVTGPFRLILVPVVKRLRDGNRSVTQRAFIALGGAAGMSSIGFGLLLTYLMILVPFTPGKDQIRRAAAQRASIIVDSRGEEIARFDRAHREWVGLDKIAPSVVTALVATEDHRFYDHHGIDYRRLASSVVHTMLGDTQGGSTITMQLARNLYPDRIGSSFGPNRKCKELVVAKKIESVFTKDEIIELYLNTVPFLYGVRGIEMAARTYYSKSADALSLDESATLVGMLKATSYYNPLRHPERSAERRNVVIGQMLRHGAIDSMSAADAAGRVVRTRFNRPQRSGSRAPHFADRVEREAATWARRNGLDLFSAGLTIHTTLDLELQGYAETAVRRQGDALQRVANVEWSEPEDRLYSTDIRDYAALDRRKPAFRYYWNSKSALVDQFIRESAAYRARIGEGANTDDALSAIRTDESAMATIRETKSRIEVGFVAIDPRNGHVRAWVGSRDYVTAPFDHVASSRRQPGSTFKPVVYAAALEAGYRPDNLVPNEPVEIKVGGSDVWRLASAGNADRYVSLREGLARSHNNVAAQLMQEVGARRTAAYGRRLGIRSSPLDEVPSLALGTSPVSLLEMASVYSTIAAEGTFREPVLITHISASSGEKLYEYTPREEEVLSQESARYLTDMLRDVVSYGTGQRIRYQFGARGDLGGKTGTTQNNMDGWFMSIHPEIVAGAWVGFDDPRVTFRTDFWGEGAHNALFVVGDVYRQSQAAGWLNTRVHFAPPPQQVDRPHFADRASTWLERQWDRIADVFGGDDDDARGDIRQNRFADSPPADRAPSDWRNSRRPWSERRSDNARDSDQRARTNDRRRQRPRSERRGASRWDPPSGDLGSALREYERLKQQITDGLNSLGEGESLEDRLIDAYRRERETNPELREFERQLDIRIRRWMDEAERRLAESEAP